MQVRIRYLLTHLEAGQAEDAEPEQRSLMFFFFLFFFCRGDGPGMLWKSCK